jgi:hypothetical protein
MRYIGLRETPPHYPLFPFPAALRPDRVGAGGQKSVRRRLSHATAAISAKTLFGATFGSACGVQLWAGARDQRSQVATQTRESEFFARGPGL